MTDTTDAPASGSNAQALDERLKRLNAVERDKVAVNLRPKDAATLLILDRVAGGELRVLMGRRHMRHKFFPGAYVFPGGRVDRGDSFVPVAEDYHPDVLAKVSHAMKGPKTASRARAFAVAAIRETYEEAGVFVGTKGAAADPRLGGEFAAFVERGVAPSLAPFRLVARAITPPKRPRRFDTRFFAVFADAIAETLPEGTGPSGELEDVAWVTFDEAKAKSQLPPITHTIMDELVARLARDPKLAPETPVPFYQWVGNGFRRAEV